MKRKLAKVKLDCRGLQVKRKFDKKLDCRGLQVNRKLKGEIKLDCRGRNES